MKYHITKSAIVLALVSSVLSTNSSFAQELSSPVSLDHGDVVDPRGGSGLLDPRMKKDLFFKKKPKVKLPLKKATEPLVLSEADRQSLVDGPAVHLVPVPSR